MTARLIGMSFVAALVLSAGIMDAAQDKKKTGTIIGEIKKSMKTPNGKNTIIEVLAPGEEKARAYRVQYDPKVKGPNPELLKAVRAAKVGDRCKLDWVDTGEGLAITKFEVLKKGKDKDDKK